jgi:hypothetical protein
MPQSQLRPLIPLSSYVLVHSHQHQPRHSLCIQVATSVRPYLLKQLTAPFVVAIVAEISGTL